MAYFYWIASLILALSAAIVVAVLLDNRGDDA